MEKPSLTTKAQSVQPKWEARKQGAVVKFLDDQTMTWGEGVRGYETLLLVDGKVMLMLKF